MIAHRQQKTIFSCCLIHSFPSTSFFTESFFCWNNSRYRKLINIHQAMLSNNFWWPWNIRALVQSTPIRERNLLCWIRILLALSVNDCDSSSVVHIILYHFILWFRTERSQNVSTKCLCLFISSCCCSFRW